MRLRITHNTIYRYPSTAIESHNEARLIPITDEHQTCLDHRITVNPTCGVYSYALPTGGVSYFNVREPHYSLNIFSECLVVTYRSNPFEGFQFIEPDEEFYADDSVRQHFCEYLTETKLVPFHSDIDRIAAVADRNRTGPGAAAFLISLTRTLHRAFEFRPGVTSVHSTISHVLEQGSGVCQDFSHLMLAICRRRGIPARYISGYLYNSVDHSVSPSVPSFRTPPEGEAIAGNEDRFDGEAGAALLGADVMHAWVECLLPDGSWRGFDPTNNLVANHHFVKVHIGRDYSDVVPLRGIYKGPTAESMQINVKVVEEL